MQFAAAVLFLGHLGELTVGSVDPLVQYRPFIAELQEECPRASGGQVDRVFENRRNLALEVGGPAGTVIPCSRRKPRSCRSKRRQRKSLHARLLIETTLLEYTPTHGIPIEHGQVLCRRNLRIGAETLRFFAMPLAFKHS